MPKVPRHETYFRRIAVVSPLGSQELQAALVTAGVAARLIPISGAMSGDVDLVEVAVTGRDEAAAREVLALGPTNFNGLQINTAHHDTEDAWDT